MAGTLERVLVARGPITVEVGLDPVAIEVRRDGRPLVEDLEVFGEDGSGIDRLIQLTEGVLVEESRGPIEAVRRAAVRSSSAERVEIFGELVGGREFELLIAVEPGERVRLELDANPPPYRVGAAWAGHPGERIVGTGARHTPVFDQTGRCFQLGADRRYTGPDCPAEMLAEGGIPQGDYAPAPWLCSSAGWAAWAETNGPGLELDLRRGARISQRTAAGPLRLHLLCASTPAARLRDYLRLTGFPALLPEWAYGHWKSRDVYAHERDVLEDFEGYLEHALPLDAIVIDSPWETQYNTWVFNPHQFPDPEGLITRMRDHGVRTVVWVTPWVNLESPDGQYPPGPESERMHREPAPNYAEGADGGHFVAGPDGSPHVGRWWMGTGSMVDFTSSEASAWWRRQACAVLELGVEGIKADDGEGYYMPPDAMLADGRSGAEAAWAYGGLYRQVMQEALDEVHPGTGVLFGRSGWSGQQATGVTWGGDQASDFWSLRVLVAATLSAAASGFSNWSHDVGGYLGRRLVERCPRELLVRWVQFGCFTPLLQSHGRFPQEAWRYDDEVLDIYREYVLLHERLVPYIRAAAATAARAGLPIIRPLCLVDPTDPGAWELADAYMFGPALWVAPVLEEGATGRSVHLPRGEWLDLWSGAEIEGGRVVEAFAPLRRTPAWVRHGSIVVTYAAEGVAAGLQAGRDATTPPLVATLWGEPGCGRAKARLADGGEVRWEHGRWSVTGVSTEVAFEEVGAG